MSFRSWVREHTGQSVRVEWESSNGRGGARVLLVGFDEAAEVEYPGGVLLAALQELDGTNRVGLRRRPDGTVPMVTLAPEIERFSSAQPTAEIVWLSVRHLKRLVSEQGDSVVCSVHDRCVVSYDDPTHADHRELACPLHDEPRWRVGPPSRRRQPRP